MAFAEFFVVESLQKSLGDNTLLLVDNRIISTHTHSVELCLNSTEICWAVIVRAII